MRRASTGMALIALSIAAGSLFAARGLSIQAGVLGELRVPDIDLARLELPDISLGDIALPDLGETLRQPRFQLHEIELIGLRALSPADLQRHLAVPTGLPLIDLDVDRVCARLHEHPRVASCVGMRLPPNRVVLEILERRPIARLLDSAMGIDATGFELPLLPEELAALPRVRGEAARALPLLEAAERHGLRIYSVEVTAAGLVTFQPAGSQLQVHVGSDVDAALARFELLLESGLHERYSAREIDLRFDGSAILRDFRQQQERMENGPS